MARVLLAVLIGNALGYAAWHAAWAALPRLWSLAETGLPVGAGGIALAAIWLAAPPVLLGALGAWLARRAQVWVGLACGLWSVTLIDAAPKIYPIIVGIWYAPTVLVLLSGALGGWMLDLRAQVQPKV